MRKFIAAILLVSICAGCTPSSGICRVTTEGSSSMEKLIGFLSEVYMEENSGVRVSFNPTGSGAGIRAAMDGRCDIGLASRALNDEESVLLESTVIAIDPIAIIVNPENPIVDLTLEQIGKIYTGEIKNWREIGGSDSRIVLIGREAASGTRNGFEAITNTVERCKYNQELTSAGDVIQAVAGNPNAIGYASPASFKDTVKIVKVEGVMPSKASIQKGDYKIQRDFLFVMPKERELTSEAKAFFEFATGKEAEKYIEMSGAIPILK